MFKIETQEILRYYSQPGIVTDPGPYDRQLNDFPMNLSESIATLQGLMVHIFWAHRYGLQLTDERKQKEVNLRAVRRQLNYMQALADYPLAEARPLEKRLIGNCRDFSTMLCAVLQHQGIPARARCGFGTYFIPEHYEDHWICEVWNQEENEWQMVDPQLDQLMCEALHITFNPLNLPPGEFITGGEAWLMCRTGKEDPNKFGIFEWHGMDFIRGDLIRDFLALNKIEILPWDGWKIMEKPFEELEEEDLRELDELAALTLGPDQHFQEIRARYQNDDRLKTPHNWAP